MLLLSEVLLIEGSNIISFDELKNTIKSMAVQRGELHFNIDIEPPMYSDHPDDWHEQLNLAFESAR